LRIDRRSHKHKYKYKHKYKFVRAVPCRAVPCRAVPARSSVPTNCGSSQPTQPPRTFSTPSGERTNTHPACYPPLALGVAPRPARTSPSRSDRSISLIGVTLSKESGLGFSVGAPLAPEPDGPAMAAALGGLPTRNACPRQSRSLSAKLTMPPD
jgi:hypothetical protein